MLSLASSGMGIAFAVAVGVELLARRPRAVLWLVPVGLGFIAWFLAWDRTATAATSGVSGSTDPNTIVAFVAFGPLSYIDALTGFGPSAAVGLYAVALLFGAATILRHAMAHRAVGATAGLAMMLALIAVARGVFGVSTTQQPRYVYEGVVFVLLAVSALLGRRAAAVPKSPTGGVVLASIVALTLVAVVRNVGLLDGGAAFFVEAAGELRAIVALTDRYGPEQLNAPPPAMNPYVPAPKDMVRIMAR